MTLIGQHARSGDNVSENLMTKLGRVTKKQKLPFFFCFFKIKRKNALFDLCDTQTPGNQ